MRHLAGGGSEYDYDVDGAEYRYFVTPAGFNALTATTAQLQEYNLPLPPSDPTALANWDAEMTNLQPVVPPPFLAELPDVHATTHYVNSDNWSGYAVTGSAAEFTSAEAIYDEPQYESSRCSTNSAVDWAGVGGYSSNVIGQDGTSYNVPGMTDHQAWSEVYPDQDIVPQDLYATVNEEFEDYANWLGSSSGWQFFMKNYYTGDYLNYVVDIDDYSGSRAEVVVERLSVGGEFTNLSNFDTDLAFYDTYANNIPLNDISPFYDIDMVSSTTGDTLAETGVISGPGAFTVTQTDCS